MAGRTSLGRGAVGILQNTLVQCASPSARFGTSPRPLSRLILKCLFAVFGEYHASVAVPLVVISVLAGAAHTTRGGKLDPDFGNTCGENLVGRGAFGNTCGGDLVTTLTFDTTRGGARDDPGAPLGRLAGPIMNNDIASIGARGLGQHAWGAPRDDPDLRHRVWGCLLYTSPSPRDLNPNRVMPQENDN